MVILFEYELYESLQFDEVKITDMALILDA